MNFTKVTQWKTLPQCKGRPTLHMSAWMNLRNTVLKEGRKSWKTACESVKIMFKSSHT